MGLLANERTYEASEYRHKPIEECFYPYRFCASGKIGDWEYVFIFKKGDSEFLDLHLKIRNIKRFNEGKEYLFRNTFTSDILNDTPFEKACEELIDSELDDMVKETIEKIEIKV